MSVGIGDSHLHLACGRSLILVENLGRDPDTGILPLNHGCVHIGVPFVEMQLVRGLQPHMTIDAAARIPTAVHSFADGMDGDSDEHRILRVAVLR